MTKKSSKWSGIIVPMITPLEDRDTLDRDGLGRLIEHILHGGVHGLFVLGTTGEGPSLSYCLRKELIERTCRQVAGRVPVMVGITDTSFTESIRISHVAAEAGASTVVLAPPYYFPAGQPELCEYVEHMLDELPLPVFLYNQPAYTKVLFEPDTVRKMADMKGVCGLKDSSCDMVYFHYLVQITRGHSDFSLLVGAEELLAEAVLLGGDGCVGGAANVCPDLLVRMYNAAVAQDMPEIIKLHHKIFELRKIYAHGHYRSSYLKGMKCALSCLGICSDFLAEPFHRFRASERDLVMRDLEAFGLLKHD
ncbi:MAG: dihydrodipicolinate synthase family protein [Planctomycetota bacterium]